MSCNPFQPLYVNTNITYNLDMERFPGLDDPICLREPALLLDTPKARRCWMFASVSASADVGGDVADDSYHQDCALSDDLFPLIESCQLSAPCDVPDVTHDDVICDLPSGGEFDFLDEIYSLPCFGPQYNEREIPCDSKTPNRTSGDKDKGNIYEDKEYISYCEDFAHLFITEIKTASSIGNEHSDNTSGEQCSSSRRFETTVYDGKSRRES